MHFHSSQMINSKFDIKIQAGGAATSLSTSKKGSSCSHMERLLSNKACRGSHTIKMDLFPKVFSETDFKAKNLCQKCDECESSFYWRDFEHGCEVSQMGKRWMAGNVLISFFMRILELFVQGDSFLAALVSRLLNATPRRVSPQ